MECYGDTVHENLLCLMKIFLEDILINSLREASFVSLIPRLLCVVIDRQNAEGGTGPAVLADAWQLRSAISTRWLK